MYKDLGMRTAAINRNKKRQFWAKFNGAASTIARELKILIRNNPNKPICFLAGGQLYRESIGHAVPVILVPKDGGHLAVVKESLPFDDARVKQIIFDVLGPKGLKFERVQLIAELPHEEEIIYSECLRESYKVVGDVLDGKKFWEKDFKEYDKPVTRMYKVSSKIEI